jgi:hypothetical protein
MVSTSVAKVTVPREWSATRRGGPGLFAVGGAFGGAARRVGAGRALSAFGVAIAGHEALFAVVGDAFLTQAMVASGKPRIW